MSKPPLWEVMYRADAYCTPASEYQEGIAPVIRAVRDWLFPVDESGDPIGYLTCAQTEDRLAFRALLTVEADRAENNDVPTKQEPQ